MGALPTGRAYTGQTEIEFGLLHYGARVYDPYLNRFLSPDPIYQARARETTPMRLDVLQALIIQL